MKKRLLGALIGAILLTTTAAGTAHAEGLTPAPKPPTVAEYEDGCRFQEGVILFNTADLSTHNRTAFTTAVTHINKATDLTIRAGTGVSTTNKVTQHENPGSSIGAWSKWNFSTCVTQGINHCVISINDSVMADQPYDYKRLIFLHELGHCLGMAHAKDTKQVLYPRSYIPYHFGVTTYSQVERDWINANY